MTTTDVPNSGPRAKCESILVFWRGLTVRL